MRDLLARYGGRTILLARHGEARGIVIALRRTSRRLRSFQRRLHSLRERGLIAVDVASTLQGFSEGIRADLHTLAR